MSVRLSVCHRNPSAAQNCSYWPLSLLTIEPIDYWAYRPLILSTIKPINHRVYRPLSLLTIKPIDHQAYRPSSLSTSGLLSRLLSLSACFKTLAWFLFPAREDASNIMRVISVKSYSENTRQVELEILQAQTEREVRFNAVVQVQQKVKWYQAIK